MKNVFRIVLVAFILIFVGFTLMRNVQQKGQSDAIYDAVLRYATTSEGNSLNMERIKNLYVDIEGKDPSSAFIQRFQGSGITVRPASQAPNARSLRSGNDFTDSSGQKAVMVRFRGISWRDSAHPFVSAGGYGFIMENIGGGWIVQNQTMATF